VNGAAPNNDVAIMPQVRWCYDDHGQIFKYCDPDEAFAKVAAMEAERDRLHALINTPETVDFIKAVQTEAAHQRERWPSEKDAGKTDADWLWLLGYLAGKALHNLTAGNTEKGLHHIITTAAACANWHHQRTTGNSMRPGIAAESA
jgi:hypothetical protein